MNPSLSKLMREQLEQILSQRIQALYRVQLGHQPGQVTCRLFDEKLVILIEDAITLSEKMLLKTGQFPLVQEMHSDLNKVLEPQLKQLIEEVVQVPVVDLLSNATLETGRSGTIAVLAALPQVQESDQGS
jgi:uncharacterized protein YbcI